MSLKELFADIAAALGPTRAKVTMFDDERAAVDKAIAGLLAAEENLDAMIKADVAAALEAGLDAFSATHKLAYDALNERLAQAEAQLAEITAGVAQVEAAINPAPEPATAPSDETPPPPAPEPAPEPEATPAAPPEPEAAQAPPAASVAEAPPEAEPHELEGLADHPDDVKPGDAEVAAEGAAVAEDVVLAGGEAAVEGAETPAGESSSSETPPETASETSTSGAGEQSPEPSAGEAEAPEPAQF